MYYLIKSVYMLLSLIPRSVMQRLSVPLGKLWFAVDRHHRKIAIDNMRTAFGDALTSTQRNQMATANFIQLARMALEMPSLLHLRKNNLDSFVSFIGEAHLKQALSQGKGVLCLSAHLGNWELMTVATALKFDLPINAIVRPIDYEPVDRLLTEIRSKTGNRILDKHDSAGLIRGMLRSNQTVGILLDQNASWYEGVFVPFFGKTTCTNKGLAMFAMRYGAPVLPIFNMPERDGRYTIVIEPPMTLSKSGDVGRDIVENTRKFNRMIEKYIRRSPESWFWVHRRWRLKDVPDRARHKIQGIDLSELNFT